MTNVITQTLNIKHAVLAVAIAGLLLSGLMVPMHTAAAQSSDDSRAELTALLNSLIERVNYLQQQMSQGSTATQSSGASLGIGDLVRTTSRLSVRQAPAGTRSGVAETGDRATVTGGPVQLDGYTWWQVSYDSGASGWSAGNWLASLSGGSGSTNTTTNTAANTPLPGTFSGDSFYASPQLGNAPLSVTVYSRYTGQGGAATLEYGDGTIESVNTCNAPADVCTDYGVNKHRYTMPGTYRIKLVSESTGETLQETRVIVFADDVSVSFNTNGSSGSGSGSSSGGGDWGVWDVETIFYQNLKSDFWVLWDAAYPDADLEEGESYTRYLIYLEDGEYPDGIKMDEWPRETVAEPDVEIFACTSCSDEEFYEAFYDAGFDGNDDQIEYLKDQAEPMPSQPSCPTNQRYSSSLGGCVETAGSGDGPGR